MQPCFFNTGIRDPAIKRDDPTGYKCFVVRQADNGWFRPLKAIYRLEVVLATPITYLASDLFFYQLDRTFEFDQGSVPARAQVTVPKDRFLGFPFHDCICGLGGL